MKYSKNRKYRDQEKTIEKEIIFLGKKIKKNTKNKKSLTEKVKGFFKNFWK